jgi:hypothetical protein
MKIYIDTRCVNPLFVNTFSSPREQDEKACQNRAKEHQAQYCKSVIFELFFLLMIHRQKEVHQRRLY